MGRWVAAITVVVCVALADPALAATENVTATPGSQFSPAAVNITQGDSVTWTNGGGEHNVVFDDGSFTDPIYPSTSAWTTTRTFDTPGTYLYYCALHGEPGGGGMAGTVVVSARAPAPSDGSGGNAPVPTGSSGQPVPASTTPCASVRRFRIRIRQPRGIRIVSAKVTVNKKPVAVKKLVIDGKLRQTAIVDLRGLGKGTYTVDIAAKTDKGKVLLGTRTYRTCIAKQVPAALPQL
jgi:plastocyanin